MILRLLAASPLLFPLAAGPGPSVSPGTGGDGVAGFRAAAAACDFPIRWKIADVDPAFGLTEDDAARAVREAGILWETAVGRALMFQESSEGIPVSFVYDERQSSSVERQRRLAEIDRQAASIEETGAEIESLRARLNGRRTIHDTRQADYDERLQSYEDQVDYWNQRGGAPPEELDRLRSAEEEIAQAREAVNAAATDVNDLVDRINATTDSVNTRIASLNQARSDLEAQFPAQRVQSGQYLDTRRGLGRITLSRDTEIRIYQFDNRAHLVQILAHELGHAMGLEHNGEDDSLMADEVIPAPEGGRAEIRPSDVERLRELCPDL
jgi:Matrixin